MSLKKVILPISLILAGILCGFMVFLIIANLSKSILIYSYDGTNQINLGDFKNITISQMDLGVAVDGDDIENVVEKLKTSQYYKYSLTLENDEEILFFGKDNYNYIAYMNNGGLVILNQVAYISYVNVVPFVTLSVSFDYSEIDWQELNFYPNENLKITKYNSYESLKTFYQTVSSELVSFDDEQKTIRLKSYQLWRRGAEDGQASDFDVTIYCFEEYLSIQTTIGNE